MTANQLAYAALQESSRHNLAGEQETVRHNTKQEEIQVEANNITKLLGELQNNREYQRNQNERELRELELQYKYAELDQKEDIQNSINALKQRELDQQQYYNEELARYRDRQNDLQEQSIANDAEYKKAWKEINMLNADLQNKRIEYEATLQREEMANKFQIQQSINALTEWRDTANYILSMQSNAQKWAELRNDTAMLQLQVEKQDEVIRNLKADTSEKKSKTFRNYFESIMNTINDTISNGFRIYDMASGGTYGQTTKAAKKAAEELFSN